MSTSETPPGPPAFNFQQWFSRLGVSGKLLLIGGVVGIIATMLPAFSSSTASAFGVFQGSIAVVNSWMGVVCLLGYIAAIIFSFMLYSTGGSNQKNLVCASLAVGGVTALFAVILVIQMSRWTSNIDIEGISVAKSSVGFGAYLNVLTAAAVAAGGFLKAREERLF